MLEPEKYQYLVNNFNIRYLFAHLTYVLSVTHAHARACIFIEGLISNLLKVQLWWWLNLSHFHKHTANMQLIHTNEYAIYSWGGFAYYDEEGSIIKVSGYQANGLCSKLLFLLLLHSSKDIKGGWESHEMTWEVPERWVRFIHFWLFPEGDLRNFHLQPNIWSSQVNKNISFKQTRGKLGYLWPKNPVTQEPCEE